MYKYHKGIRIAWFAFVGAIVSGLGYYIASAPIISSHPVIGIYSLSFPGVLIGASLGAASEIEWRRIPALTVGGGIGFALGIIFSIAVLSLTGWEHLSHHVGELRSMIIYYGILGLFTGAGLGLALSSRRLAIRLALVGGLSFALGAFIIGLSFQLFDAPNPDRFGLVYLFDILPGFVGGAFFGAGWGFLKIDKYIVAKREGNQTKATTP
ncbi:MAG: hypothetical protein ACYSR0_07460 [Planctomycetota bacterium]